MEAIRYFWQFWDLVAFICDDSQIEQLNCAIIQNEVHCNEIRIISTGCFARSFSFNERLWNAFLKKKSIWNFLFSFGQWAWVKRSVLKKPLLASTSEAARSRWIVGQTHQFNKRNLFWAVRAQHIDIGVVGNSPQPFNGNGSAARLLF